MKAIKSECEIIEHLRFPSFATFSRVLTILSLNHRIHSVLRLSDDFCGKYKQERRGSKTQDFDHTKDPVDLAVNGSIGHLQQEIDVHKVISEIHMAIQIAKQITSLANAVMVRSGVSSDEGKKSRRATKDTAILPNPMRNPTMQQKIRKADPLHKYRVAVSSDGPAKKHTAAGNRKEVLYPKSKQPIPDRSRLEDENELTLSIGKKMQSRRSLRAAKDLWSAKDITNSKSQQPQVDVRVANDIINSKPHQNQADLRAAEGITNKRHNQFQGNVGAAKDITDVKSHQSQTNMRAAKDTPKSNSNRSHPDLTAAKEKINKSKCPQPQVDMRTAKETTNSKSNQPQADNRPASDVTNCRSQPRVQPGLETKKVVVPVIQKLAPYRVRRARSSKSPPRTLVAKPQLSNTSSTKSLERSFIIKQDSKGLHHTRTERRGATSSTAIPRAGAPTSTIKRTRQLSLPADTSVLSSRAKELVDVKVESALRSPSSSATTTEIEMWNPCPSVLPVDILVLSPRADGPVHVKQVSATSAASQEIKKSNPSPDELFEPALEGLNIHSSSIPESRTCSVATSAQVKITVQDSHRHFRSNNPIDSLRHKFVMEATEITGTDKPWHFMHRSRSCKAVLFSNAAFAPASPNGARPASEKRQWPVADTPPKSPSRSISATRRVMDRIGRAISPGRRSISPEITRRLNSTRQKLAYLSPGKSVPSLISRLPSRGKREPSPVPRASVIKSNSCARPSPQSKELPLPPAYKFHQRELLDLAQAKDRTTFHTSGSPSAASTDSSSYFSLRRLEELNSTAQQFPFEGLQGLQGDDVRYCSKGKQILPTSNANQLKWHTSLDWEKEMGIVGVLSSCRKWVEESAPPLPGGFRRYEQQEMEPAPQEILIKENVVATDWEDELAAPPILSTSTSRKVEDNDVQQSGGGSCTNPGELKSSLSGVRRSFSTGRIRTGASFLKRARDLVRQRSSNHVLAFTNWHRSQLTPVVSSYNDSKYQPRQVLVV